MNKEIKEKWCTALRYGGYKQGRGQLKLGDKFCCLGVLCNIHSQENPSTVNKWHRPKNEFEDYSYLGSDQLLPREVKKWAGLNAITKLTDKTGELTPIGTLIELNDGDASFRSIATCIEALL
jgi:hypothetical protein